MIVLWLFPLVMQSAWIDRLQEEMIPILGGDILKYDKGRLDYTYENWSHAIEQPHSVFVNNSCDDARQNIERFASFHKNDMDIIFVDFVLLDDSHGKM